MDPIKKKKALSFNLFIIPEGHPKISRIHLSRKQVVLIGIGVVFFLGSFSLSQAGFWYYRTLYSNMAREKLASNQFEQSKKVLLDKLTLLEKTVGETENLAGKLSSMVGPSRVDLKRGLGPIPEKEFEERFKGDVSLAALDPKIDELKDKTLTLQQKIKELYTIEADKINFLSATPSIWPVKGWVTSDFGYRRSPFTFARDFHPGIDIAAQWGSPVFSPADGVVSFSGYKGGLGKTVIIDHGFGVTSYFGHNSRLLVAVGQKVKKGMKISQVGNTGHSTGPHMHYEIHVDDVPVDPMKYLLP